MTVKVQWQQLESLSRVAVCVSGWWGGSWCRGHILGCPIPFLCTFAYFCILCHTFTREQLNICKAYKNKRMDRRFCQVCSLLQLWWNFLRNGIFCSRLGGNLYIQGVPNKPTFSTTVCGTKGLYFWDTLCIYWTIKDYT